MRELAQPVLAEIAREPRARKVQSPHRAQPVARMSTSEMAGLCAAGTGALGKPVAGEAEPAL
jgi:hypothetical protein